ncbi:MAG: HNH endonuclease [Bacteroidia bacterium]|nr:HNH endonuclease [Bacteroidia bacterium]
MNQEILNRYLIAFSRLKRGVTKYGPAPHKPILLLSVLQAVKSNLINDNKIYVTPELIFLFKDNWNRLVNTQHVSTFALPFFHLHKEKSGIWNLVTKPGFEPIIKLKESISSLTELNNMIEYAMLNNELFQLLKDDVSNQVLQKHIIETYFPSSNYVTDFQLNFEIENLNGLILNESPETYKIEIKSILADNDEDEIFLRGSLFKREIPRIYNNTCCVSGMRIEAITNISMIDACHIVPFSVSYDDTITNGIALCPNLHRAFDRGLISIDKNYKVIVSKHFRENETDYSIKSFEGTKINLPEISRFNPLQDNFDWHRNNVFKS